MIMGVTTAATLWFVTIIGLCFGGGQLELGIEAVIVALFVLWALKFIEKWFLAMRRGVLTLTTDGSGLGENELLALIQAPGQRVVAGAMSHSNQCGRRSYSYEIVWRCEDVNRRRPALLEELAVRPGVLSIHWQPANH
jgi:putative Mg2+ transporter-C (MgtC) family protein